MNRQHAGNLLPAEPGAQERQVGGSGLLAVQHLFQHRTVLRFGGHGIPCKLGYQGRPVGTLHTNNRGRWIVGLKRLDQLLEV